MKGPLKILVKNVSASVDAMQRFMADEGRLAGFARAVELIVERYHEGGRLYLAGNGGSAADAQHVAAEFVGRLARDRAPLPAEALTANSSIITAIGNDYGFEHVFARQLAAKATAKDLFLGITTSGRSANILRALEECRRIGIPGIVLTGRDGGPAAVAADLAIIAFGEQTSTIQESHILLAHTLCECVEDELFRGEPLSGQMRGLERA